VDVDDVRVEEMISASVEHAFDDMHERQWTAAKLKAEELLEAVAAALPAAGNVIDSDTRFAIQFADGEVRAALAAEDLPRLKKANEQLDTATETLAAIIVERAMEESMQRRGLI
jgi:molecular chaperone DnaK